MRERRPQAKRARGCSARFWTALAVTFLSVHASPALDKQGLPTFSSNTTPRPNPTVPCLHRRNARPRVRLRSGVFRLRGGRDLEEDNPRVYVPDFVADIQRAIDQASADGSTVMISANGPPEVYDWSEKADGTAALRLHGNCRIRGEGSVELTGSSLLEVGSSGTIQTVRWFWSSAMGAQFPEMLSVQGGPWTFTRCELKATDVCVTRCRGRAILLLEDTAIGGHGKGMLDDERTTARATEGVAAEGHSTVHLRDCTLQVDISFSLCINCSVPGSDIALLRPVLWSVVLCGVSRLAPRQRHSRALLLLPELLLRRRCPRKCGPPFLV